MSLLGSKLRKPRTNLSGGKFLFMGETGSGKTSAGLTFPNIALFDAENGATFYEADEEKGKNLFGIINSQSYIENEEVVEEIGELALQEKDKYYTLMTDSETKVYQSLVDAVLRLEERKAIAKGRDAMDSNVSVRGWGRVKSLAQRLQNQKIDLSAKGVHIVSIAQLEDIKEKKGDNFVKTGEKPIMQKGTQFDYDVIVKFKYIEKDGEEKYVGKILKDRTNVTKRGQIIENVGYHIWEEYFNNIRQTGESNQTNMSAGSKSVEEVLHKQDIEAEKTAGERIIEVSSISDDAKTKVTQLIKALKISDVNALTATQSEKLTKGLDAIKKNA